MSWPQWPQPTGAVAGWSGTGLAPAAAAVGPLQTPGTPYTPEQWAAMQQQQQNWQQWVQWQQQYQQWQQQYGEQYQKSLALAGQNTAGVSLMPVQPPLPAVDPKSVPPLPTEIRPPLPPEEPPRNVPATAVVASVTYNVNVPPPNVPPPHVPPPQVPPQSQVPPQHGSQQQHKHGLQQQNISQHDPHQQLQNSSGQNYGQNQYSNTNQLPSLLSLTTSKPSFIDNQPQSRNNNFRSDFGNKRPGDFNNDHSEDIKKNRWDGSVTEKPEPKQWNSNQSQQRNQQWSGNKSAGQRPNVEELSDAEKNFDKQFEQWEAQFNKWKDQNAGHPDKQQYKEYEAKWESWRTQLLDRREQMRKKRLGLHGSPAQSTGPKPNASFTLPTATMNLPVSDLNEQEQTKPNLEPNINKDLPVLKQSTATPEKTSDKESEFKSETKESANSSENDISVLFSQPPKEQRTNIRQRRASIKSDTEGTADTSFLQTNTANEGGIPGLDLVKDDDSKLPDNNDEEKKAEIDPKLPDYEAISKGINSILGDEKLLSMLSMVAQNKKIDPLNTDSQNKTPNSNNPVQTDFNNSYQSNDSFNNQNFSNDQFGKNQLNKSFDQQIQNQSRDMQIEGPPDPNNCDFRGPPNFNQPPPNNFQGAPPHNEFNKFPINRGEFESGNRGPTDFGPQGRGLLNDFNQGQGSSNNYNRGPNNFNQGPPGRAPNFNKGIGDFNQGPPNRGGPGNYNQGPPSRGLGDFKPGQQNRGPGGAPFRGPDINQGSQNRGPGDFNQGPPNRGGPGPDINQGSQNRGQGDFNQGPTNRGGPGPFNPGPLNRGAGDFNQGPPRGPGEFNRGPNDYNPGPLNRRGSDDFSQPPPNKGSNNFTQRPPLRGPNDFNQGSPNRGPNNFNQGPSNRGPGDFNQPPPNRGSNDFDQGPPHRGPGDFNQGPPNRGSADFNQGPSNRSSNDFNKGPQNREPGDFNQGPLNRSSNDFNKGLLNRGPGDFNQGPPNRGPDFNKDPQKRGPGNFVQGPEDFNQDPQNRGPGDFNQGPPNRGASNRGSNDFNQGPQNKEPGDFSQGPLNRGPANFNQGLPNRGPENCNQGAPNRGPGDFNLGPLNKGPGDFNQGPPNRGSGDFNQGPPNRGPGDFNQGPPNRGSGDFNQGPPNRGPGDFNQGPPNRGSGDFNQGPPNRVPGDFNQGPPNRGPGDFNQGPPNRGSGDFNQGPPNRGPGDFNQGPPNRGPGDFNQGPPNRSSGDFNQRLSNRGPADINRGTNIFNQGSNWGQNNRGPQGQGPDHQRPPPFNPADGPQNREFESLNRPPNLDQWNQNSRASEEFSEQGFSGTPKNLIQVSPNENENQRQEQVLDREDHNQIPDNFDNTQDFGRNHPGRWSGDNFSGDKQYSESPRFPNPNMRRSNPEQFSRGSNEKYWDEALILKPVTVIDYGHKSLNKPETNFIEPVQTFDYGHTSKTVDKKLHDTEPSRIFPGKFNKFNDPVSKFNDPVSKFNEPLSKFNEPVSKFNESGSKYNDSVSKFNFPPKLPALSSGNKHDDSMFYRKSYDNRKSQETFDRFSYKNKKLMETSYNDKNQYEDIDDYEDDPFEEPDFNRSSNERELEPFVNKPNPSFENESPLSKIKEKSVTMIEDLLAPPGRNTRPPRIAIILRGPPGSGKTFLAKLIKDKEVEHGGCAPRILSLDDYFMVDQDKEVFDKETGRKTLVKEMVYEYEECMELAYRQSLEKAFKKTITDGFFPFIILDCVNDKEKHFSDMWSFAKQNGFQAYVCQLELDVAACTKRNVHHRSEIEIERLVAGWEPTPSHHLTLDATSLIQAGCISDVEMEEVIEIDDEEKDDEDFEGHVISKWERMEPSGDKLARLDGTSKPLRPRATMEDYLQLDDDIPEEKPGLKRVRWADLEERRQQEKIRAIGFVVGQTDWGRMMDPTQGSGALTQTKYIERVRRF